MKIGINASFARKPNTGIGQVTINFLKKLIELKTQEEYVLYLEEDLPRGFKLPKNFEKKIVLPLWKRDDLIRAMWRDRISLPKQIKKDNCDVFFNLYQSAIILPKNIKHIMLVHDVILELFPDYLNNNRKRLFWKMTKEAIKKADKIVAVSRRTEKDLIQHLGIDSEKITVNYIGADEIYKKEISEEQKNKILKKYRLKPGYILAGGGMEVRKNVEGVIRAYNELYERNKKLHFVSELPKLVIYGKLMPELAPLALDAKKLVKELNLTQQIKLLGEVSQKNLPALFSAAVCFVYPSRYEGFGLPVLEAMSVGTPVITSKTSSLPEVGGDAVLYCHPEDPDDIAMVIRNVLLNSALRDTLSRRAKERARIFSWEKFTEKMLNIIENIKPE